MLEISLLIVVKYMVIDTLNDFFTGLSNTESFLFKLSLDCQPANNDMEAYY